MSSASAADPSIRYASPNRRARCRSNTSTAVMWQVSTRDPLTETTGRRGARMLATRWRGQKLPGRRMLGVEAVAVRGVGRGVIGVGLAAVGFRPVSW